MKNQKMMKYLMNENEHDLEKTDINADNSEDTKVD